MAFRAVQAVAEEARRLGCEELRARVLRPAAAEGRTAALRTESGGTVAAGAYVFACGPWLAKLFPEILGVSPWARAAGMPAVHNISSVVYSAPGFGSDPGASSLNLRRDVMYQISTHHAHSLKIAVAVLAFQLPSLSVALAMPRESERWTELTTSNFRIFSSAGEKRTERIAEDLEQLLSVVGQLMQSKSTSPVPTYVYVFANDKKFDPYKRLYRGRPTEVGGYFIGSGHANYIAINGDRSLDTNHIIYHELIHFVMRYSMPELPLWLNEGMAEFFGAFDIRGSRAKIGNPVLGHLQWLRNHRLMPLRELFGVDRDSPDYNEQSRKGAFYAQSWALVHLLMTDEKYYGNLGRFLELTRGGTSQVEALAEAYGTDDEQLGKELHDYVRNRSMAYLWLDVEEMEHASAVARPMSHPETLARLGDLLTFVEGRESDAERHLEAALATNEGDAVALSGLAFLALRQDRGAQALAYYRRALDSAADDYLIQYRLALCLMRTAGPGGGDWEEARSALRRSLELNPEYAPTWATLAYLGTFETEPSDQTKEIAEIAYAKMPTRDDVATSLLLILARRGDRDAAQKLFERRFASKARPKVLAKARSALLEMDLREVNRLHDEGRLKAALELLETLRDRGGSPREKAIFEENLRRLRAEAEEERFVEEYNRAVSFLNRGDHASAADVLKKLVDEGGSRATEAKELLNAVESRMNRKEQR